VWRFDPSIGRLVDLFQITFVDSTFYTGSRNGAALHAVDAKTGRARWTTVVPGLEPDGAVRQPAADKDIVVAAYWRPGKPTTGGVIAVDATTGAIRWNTPLPKILPDSDSSGGYAILWRDLVIASSNSSRLFGIDRATGTIRWTEPGVGRDPPSQKWGRPVIFDLRGLVIANDRLFASSMYGWLMAYDPATGREIWRSDPAVSDGNGSPIFADKRSVYVTFFTGVVVTFATSDGAVRAIANKTELISPVALAEDRFFVSGDRAVYAYAK
jgi:outer membrane protein assembly factor BamB